MDRGELYKHEFEILPSMGGGFIVTLGSSYERVMRGDDSDRRRYSMQRWAFSNLSDLLEWLAANAPPAPGEGEKEMAAPTLQS